MKAKTSLPKEKLTDMLSKMLKIRAFEQKAEELFALGKVHGTMHLSIGQEGSAVGAVAALRPDDWMTSTAIWGPRGWLVVAWPPRSAQP